jgi:RND family efflux transporter MFP subunit
MDFRALLFASRQSSHALRVLALFALLWSFSCAGGGNAGPPGGGPPAMGVEFVTLEPKPVEEATEYIATVKSRRATKIQPEVEGFLTGIHVRSGDRVRAGQVLMEIDSGKQTASVASLESDLVALEADAAYARQQAARLEKLYTAGAVSEQELQQGRAALEANEARLEATKQQIREQRVELSYHAVTAPVAGIVGDVPVRVGNRVTPATTLTTIDSNALLEVYVYVPVQRVGDLRTGLPLRLVEDSGTVLAETKITFVSPKVDESTQAILAKAPLPDNGSFRDDQIVRARVVWSTDPGLTVPVVAVSRVSGRFFAFVAEEADGMTVARQRAVRLGPIVGNDYVVLDGLAAGERLIVSGVQKIGDGMPVNARPAGAPAAPPAEAA